MDDYEPLAFTYKKSDFGKNKFLHLIFKIDPGFFLTMLPHETKLTQWMLAFLNIP